MNNREWKKLGEICEINPSKKEIHDIDGNTPVSFIPMASVSEDGKIIAQEERRIKEVIKGFTYFRERDVLIAKITPCFENGKRALAKCLKHEIGFGTTEFHVLRIKPGVLPEWVYYAISSHNFRADGARNMTGTAGQKRVPKQFLENYQIPIPPLPIQQKIVSILERAESLKQKREQANEEANKIIQCIFYEMFGDPITNENKYPVDKLNNICDVRDGTHDSPKYKTEGFPLVTSKNVKEGYIDFSTANLISKEDLDKINKRSAVDDGDIIMPMIGTIGNPIIIKKDREFGIKNVALIKFNKSKMSNIYIKCLLSGSYFDYMAGGSSRGGTQKFIALEDIRNIPIPLPPISLQNQFSSIVEKIEGIKQKQNKAAAEINTLFDALLQKAFKGDWSHKPASANQFPEE